MKHKIEKKEIRYIFITLLLSLAIWFLIQPVVRWANDNISSSFTFIIGVVLLIIILYNWRIKR